MRSRTFRITAVAMLAMATVGVGLLTTQVSANDRTAKAVLRNAAGAQIGVVQFIQRGDAVLVKADDLSFPSALAPGFKGFHIHSVGICDAAAVDPATGSTVPFFSAGGHYNPGATGHGSHGGDMPVLQVNDDGSAWTRFKTDHYDVADILGRAVIVHRDADNFGNVPVGTGAAQYTPNSIGTTNAYATGLTANTGNAGPRYACGVVAAN